MSTERTVSQRVADLPRNTPRVVLGLGLTIGLALVVRIVTGTIIDDPVNPVTYLSLIGGGFGATAMYLVVYSFDEVTTFAPTVFWGNVLGDGELQRYREQGFYLHVTYGAIVGSFYPRVLWVLTSDGRWFAELPLSLATGTGFGIGLFVLGVVYAQVGFFKFGSSTKQVGMFLANHLVYGLVLGFVSGLWLTAVESMV